MRSRRRAATSWRTWLVRALGLALAAAPAAVWAADDAHAGHDHGGREGHAEPATHAGHDHDEHDDRQEADAHAGHGHGEEVHAVPLTRAEREEFGIEVGVAGPGHLETAVSLPGEVRVNEDRFAHVTPRVSGVVEEVRARIGDRVEAGQVLAVLASSELGELQIEYMARRQADAIARTELRREDAIHRNTARVLELLEGAPDLDELLAAMADKDLGEYRSRLVSTYAGMLLARTTFERERTLVERNISSQAEYLEAENRYEQARATYLATVDEITFALERAHIERHRAADIAREAVEAKERRLELLGVSADDLEALRRDHAHEVPARPQQIPVGRVEIRAPLSGVVLDKHLVLGELVHVEDQVFTVADMGTVWVDLRVYQRDLAHVRTGLGVTISAGEAVPEARGTISYLAPSVSQETRTVLARVVLENPQGLWRPGLFVRGHIRAEEAGARVVVPRTALQTVDGRVSVFVETGEGFEPRPVRIGRSDADSVEVLEGLRVGERLVTAGSFHLKAELGKGDFGDGHAH